MGKTLQQYRTKLDQVVKDSAGRMTQDARDAAVAEAVAEHSRHRPRLAVTDVAGDGSTYDIPLGAEGGVADWDEGFSVVRQVEYPAGEREPVILERDTWTEYVTPTGRVLRLLETTPQSGASVRVTWTRAHSVTTLAGTVPDSEFDPVSNLAGSIAAAMLAAEYAQQGDSTIGADSVDHKSKSAEYTALARELRARYFKRMGITDERGAGAASVSADWDLRMGHGQDFLTHPKEWR